MTKAIDEALDVERRAREIVAKTAEHLGYCDEDVEQYRSGTLDGDEVLAVQAVEEAIRALKPATDERKAVEPTKDRRYPSVFYSEDREQRISVGHYRDHNGPQAFVCVETLLENKPGGAWVQVQLPADEAEQMALHLLSKVESCRSDLAAAIESPAPPERSTHIEGGE